MLTIFDYLPRQAAQLVKRASMESKLPWYGVTAGTIGGAAAGGALVPKKFRALGQLGGALAGTAVGLEGGEAIGRAIDKRNVKVAALPEPPTDPGEAPQEGNNQLPAQPKHPALHALGAVGAGLGGLAAGTLAGYGAHMLVEKATNRAIPSGPLRSAAPILGGAAGLAYTLYKQREMEELQRAVKSYRNQSAGRDSGR